MNFLHCFFFRVLKILCFASLSFLFLDMHKHLSYAFVLRIAYIFAVVTILDIFILLD